MTFAHEVLTALAELRRYAATYPTMGLSAALNTLDDAGVFAALDEQADTERAGDMLAESTAQEQLKHHRGVAPEEALQVLHNTWQREHRHGRRDPLAGPAEPVCPGYLDRERDTLRCSRQPGHWIAVEGRCPTECLTEDGRLFRPANREAVAGPQGYAAASRLGKLEAVPGTNRLRPARQEAAQDAGEWSEDVVRAAFPE